MRRRLLQLRLNEDENDAARHVAEFEKIVNESRTLGEDSGDKSLIAHFQATLASSYDNVIVYFDASPVENRTLATLKARFMEEYFRRKGRNQDDSTKKQETDKAAFMTNYAEAKKGGNSYRDRNRRVNNTGNRFNSGKNHEFTKKNFFDKLLPFTFPRGHIPIDVGY